jgi:peroxiredoxin Q/BCP
MPEVAVVDLRGAEPELAWIHRGSSTFDRPDVEEVLGVLDDRRADEAGPT